MARHALTPRRRPRARRPRDAGFTLVEILVVLAILATLMGLVVAVVPQALKQKEVTRAKGLINAVGATLDLLKNDQDSFGKYPPTRMRDLKIGKALVGKDLGQFNETNCGVEVLWYLMNNDQVRIDRPPNSDDTLVGNTDGDNFKTTRGTNDAVCREYIDPWGRPLVYYHCNDYKDPKGVTTIKDAEGNIIEVHPRKAPSNSGGGWLFPNTFQLFSLGPNGKQDDPDSEDDDDIVYLVP